MARYKVYEKGYKAFEKGMICRGKQYKENTIFTEDNAELCHSGIHFCKEPLDILNYYPLIDSKGNFTEFAEVEALDECKTQNDKSCTKKIKIKSKIGFMDLFKAQFELDFSKENFDVKDNNLNNNDDSAKIGSSGDSAKIGSSGYSAKITIDGQYSIGSAIGYGSIIKAKKGNWIVLAEWEYDENISKYIPICVKTAQIDGEILKEDTFYKLENGEFVEAKINE